MLRQASLSLLLLVAAGRAGVAQAPLVLQTDFGLTDGSVAAMKGVALSIAPGLQVHDLTHLIPPYDVREAALRLRQALRFWPRGTVFVSVVDPGVGTDRRAIVARTRSGHYIVTPDNGTLTFVADAVGLEAVREPPSRGTPRPRRLPPATPHARRAPAVSPPPGGTPPRPSGRPRRRAPPRLR